jgi:hypothetical protein
LTLKSECDDGAVALHSTCGHNRKASFQDWNSRLSPHHDAAGTFAYLTQLLTNLSTTLRSDLPHWLPDKWKQRQQPSMAIPKQ